MTKTSPPQVSIVLPAYNRAQSIVDAIQSVLRQTFEDFELIVVDDGSADNTAEIAQGIKDPRVRVIALPENTGPSGARNRGIKEARADWVAFQDSDDEWLPEKLAQQMARLNEPDSDWIGAYCGMITIGENTLTDDASSASNARSQLSYLPPSHVTAVQGHIKESLLRTSLISTQMLVARRDILTELNGFDEGMTALEDWELVLRLADHGPIAFVDQPLVLQRFSDNSITRDQSRRLVARKYLLAKHQDSFARHPDILAQQLRVLAGEQRRVGDLQDARATIARALKLKPLRADLWVRFLYLRLSSLRG